MGNPRVLIYAALGFLLLQIWTSWQIDYGPKPQPPQPVATGDTVAVPDTQGAVTDNDLPSPATAVVTNPISTDTPGVAAPVSEDQSAPVSNQQVRVLTDTIDVTLGTRGGDINGVKLNLYPTSIDTPDDPFVLMSDQPDLYFIAQSGLQSRGPESPNHHAMFTVDKTEYVLQEGEQELRVPLRWQGTDGTTVVKTYVFKRDSYEIRIEYEVTNNSAAPWTVNQYRQLRRKPVTDDEQQAFIYTYIGGVVSTPDDRYQKIKFDDFDEPENNQRVTGGWAAIIEHYFVGAWIPGPEETNSFYTKKLASPERYIIGMQSDAVTVQPGATETLTTSIFAGPKIQERMRKVAEHLDLTVDYGMLSFIAKPIFWLLQKLHGILGNWGWAIVGVTMVIKLIFYKLSEASYRSMARMRKLQPQLVSLKERYGDDRAKMGQATMELYKKEKVNPLGGCLPILVQIPVFISLYWVLLESVELRQAPWILWIRDLSLMDKFYVLPLIMGVTMFIQQRLNPAPIDPIQAKVFMVMPILFTFFFAFFPAGLVLYWVSNNTLSIAQQYYITRHVLAEK